jgi:hypothetical protein
VNSPDDGPEGRNMSWYGDVEQWCNFNIIYIILKQCCDSGHSFVIILVFVRNRMLHTEIKKNLTDISTRTERMQKQNIGSAMEVRLPHPLTVNIVPTSKIESPINMATVTQVQRGICKQTFRSSTWKQYVTVRITALRLFHGRLWLAQQWILCTWTLLQKIKYVPNKRQTQLMAIYI